MAKECWSRHMVKLGLAKRDRFNHLVELFLQVLAGVAMM